VSLRFDPLQLTGGTYFAEAFFLDETDTIALTPNGRQSSWFSVTGRAISSTGDHGVFEPDVTWSHSQFGSMGTGGFVGVEGGTRA
jgi:hypothetical protein